MRSLIVGAMKFSGTDGYIIGISCANSTFGTIGTAQN